jgi:hypothetical protein
MGQQFLDVGGAHCPRWVGQQIGTLCFEGVAFDVEVVVAAAQSGGERVVGVGALGLVQEPFLALGEVGDLPLGRGQASGLLVGCRLVGIVQVGGEQGDPVGAEQSGVEEGLQRL